MGFSRHYGSMGKSKQKSFGNDTFKYYTHTKKLSIIINSLNFHHSHLLLKENSRIKVMEGAKNNLPDADAQKAAEGIQQLASELKEEDLLLVLISGKN